MTIGFAFETEFLDALGDGAQQGTTGAAGQAIEQMPDFRIGPGLQGRAQFPQGEGLDRLEWQ